MKRVIVTGTLGISSAIAALILATEAQASPQCYGIAPSGATMDLSQLCSSSQEPRQVPNENPIKTKEPEVKTAPESANQPSLSPEQQSQKDLQACLQSPQCSRVLGGDVGNSTPQTMPSPGQIERVRSRTLR